MKVIAAAVVIGIVIGIATWMAMRTQAPRHAATGPTADGAQTLGMLLPPEAKATAPVSPASRVAPNLVRAGDKAAVRKVFHFLREEQLADGREFIQFDIAAAGRLGLHDTFEIQLAEGQAPAIAVIENITGFEGIKRLTGTLLESGAGQAHRFSLTLSSDGTYAAGNFHAGDRSYSLESKNGVGWITRPENEAPFLHRSESSMQ